MQVSVYPSTVVREPTECPACAGDEFWHIAEVLERDRGLTPVAVWIDEGGQPTGSFEVLRRNTSLRAQLTTSGQPCLECLGTDLWHLQMFDQIARGAPLAMAGTT